MCTLTYQEEEQAIQQHKKNYRKEGAGTHAKLKRASKIKNSERLICRLNQHHQQNRPSIEAQVHNSILENSTPVWLQ